MWYVYILTCKDGSFYTGVSCNVKKRVLRHNSGRGAEYTKIRRPVELIYIEEFEAKQKAVKREREIKKLGVRNKRRLIKFGLGQRFPSAHKV